MRSLGLLVTLSVERKVWYFDEILRLRLRMTPQKCLL